MSIIKEEFKENQIKKIGCEVDCFKCNKKFSIRFVNASNSYGKKNNWGYWTEKEEYNEQYICSDCLKNLYYTDYVSLCNQITKKKKNILKTYLSSKIL